MPKPQGRARGRPATNLLLFRTDIKALLKAKVPNKKIYKWLWEEFQLDISISMLRRKYTSWGIYKRLTEDVKVYIRNRVVFIFFSIGLEDSDMLCLLAREGTLITHHTLVRVRFLINLKRRIRNKIERAATAETARGLIKEQLLEGIINRYGKKMLQMHFKQRGMFFPRDLLFREYC